MVYFITLWECLVPLLNQIQILFHKFIIIIRLFSVANKCPAAQRLITIAAHMFFTMFFISTSLSFGWKFIS